MGQLDDSGSQELISYAEGDLPSAARTYSLQKDQAYGFITFKSIPEEDRNRLVASLKAEGATLSVKVENPELSMLRYEWRLTDASFPVKLMFADLPPITLVKSEPLEMKADGLALLRSRFILSVIPLAEGQTEAVVTFSEPIRTEEVKLEGPADWLDRQRLKITTDPTETKTTVNLRYVYSESGKALSGMEYQEIDVLRAAVSKWYEEGSGPVISWSALDGYYDYISPSPDGSSYVGLLKFYDPDGDAHYTGYSLVLEQKGRAPRVLKDLLFLDLMDYSPVAWIDNSHFFLTYNDAVERLDTGISSGGEPRSQVVFSKPTDGWISGSAYDRAKDRLYVTETRYDSKTYGEYLYPVDMQVFSERGTKQIADKKEYLVTYDLHKYHPMTALPLFRRNATYWRGTVKGNAVTWLEQSGGSRSEVPLSRWITGDEQGVYLEKIEVSELGNTGTGVYQYWEPNGKGSKQTDANGSPLGKIRNLPAPPTGYYPRPFGSKLIARTWTEGKPPYVLFDKASWKWVPLPESMKNSFVPVQYETRYYRAPVRTS